MPYPIVNAIRGSSQTYARVIHVGKSDIECVVLADYLSPCDPLLLPRAGGIRLEHGITRFLHPSDAVPAQGSADRVGFVLLPRGVPHPPGPLEGSLPIHIDLEERSDTLQVTIYDPRSPAFTFVARPADGLPKAPTPLSLPPLEDISAGRVALPAPPMGWNSWNHFAERIDDATVREVADAMVSTGMRDAGYVYVVVDDGWTGLRDPQGQLTANKKFPDMAALATYVHSRGLKFGLYSSPGPTTCAAYPGSFGREKQDAKTLAAWGVDYLKYDWCSASEIYPTRDMRAVFQRMGQALQQSGRVIVLAICQYGLENVEEWGAAAGGTLWRISPDIQDSWVSMRNNAVTAEAVGHVIPSQQWNDADLLEVGNAGMTACEYRTHMSLWALLSAPLIAGNDPRHLDKTTQGILLNTEVIAVDQDPLGRPASVLSKQSDLEIWTKPMADGSLVVGIVNTASTPRYVQLTWSDVGLAATPVKARDLWQHADLSIAPRFPSFTLPVHDTALLRLQTH